MDSLLTLSIADYHLVDLTLRFTATLVAAVALLLVLCTMCVERRRRLPLILGGVGLGAAAWFGRGVASAWRGAFELAGSSYCVTGLPLAGEDRILAWIFALPLWLFCLGLLHLERGSKSFRNLCWLVLGTALLGPFFDFLFLLGFVFSVHQLRGHLIPAPAGSPPIITVANRIIILGMTAGILLTEAGHRHLLPLGKSADAILVHGELIRSFSDMIALALPGAALLVCILNLPQKEGRGS